MSKKIKFEITSDGRVIAKTIGMDDESCLKYVDILEQLLDAKTIDSSFTDEFLQAQQRIRQEDKVVEKRRIQERN